MSQRKVNIIIFLSGFIGYLLGITIFDLLLDHTNTNNGLRFICGVVFGLFILGLVFLFFLKRHPKVIYDMKIEQIDERERMINAKASLYTLYFVLITLFLGFVISIFMDQGLISLIFLVMFLIITVFYMALLYHYKKIM